MGKIRQEHYLFFWFALALMISAVLCSKLFCEGVVSYPVLYAHLKQGWEKVLSGNPDFVWRTVSVRTVQFLTVIFCLNSRMKKAAVWLLPVWAGCCTAVLITVLTWSRGIAGFLCFLGIVLPHGLCYGAGMLLLMLGCTSGHIVRKGRFWCAVTGLLSFGIILEIWISPWILRFLC